MPRSQSVPEGIAKSMSRIPSRNSQLAQDSTVVQDSTIKEQFLPESIEICCPVCGCINLSQDETGQIFCDECDFVDVAEI
jgi:hypothetical protein